MSVARRRLGVGVVSAALALAGVAEAAPARRSTAARDVVVPGGTAFVSSVLGMAFVTGEDDPSRFMERLVALLQEPGMFPRARRLEHHLEDVAELREVLEELAHDYQSVVPRLDREGSYSYRRAENLLDFMGVEVREDDGVFSLGLRDGDTAQRRRVTLGHMGLDVESRLDGWKAGEPIDLEIHDDVVPLMFGADVWRQQVFRDDHDGLEIFHEFIENPRPRRLLLGFSRLDDATREHVFREVGLRAIHRDERFLEGFEKIAPYLRVRDGAIRLPGDDRDAWQELLGRWDDDVELLEKLAKEDDGRSMRFLRALSLVDEGMASYLLTGGGSGPEARRDWAEDIYDRTAQPGREDMMRWNWDFAELAVHLELAPDGGIAWPGGRRAWLAAVRGDGIIDERDELDRELQRAAEREADSRRADLEILEGLLRETDPDTLLIGDERKSLTTQRFLAVSAALRYQPQETIARAAPLLYRSYPRYGVAFGFLVIPRPLAPETIEAFLFQLQRADRIGERPGRTEALRQLQAMLVLLRRMILNGAIPGGEVDSVLQSFFALPSVSEPGVFGSTELGFGPPLLNWWSETLMPVLESGGIGGGTVVERALRALVGRAEPVPLSVGGIEYVYDAPATRRRTIEQHLRQMQAPPLEPLFALDTLARQASGDVRDGDDGEVAGLADALEATLAEFLEAVPPAALERHDEDMLRAPIERRDLAERVERLARNLRRDDRDDDDVARVRNAASCWLGDALTSLVYAIHMGDPESLFFRDRPLAWAHSFDGSRESEPEVVFQALEPTAETSDPRHGVVLSNSLSGVPAVLGMWNLEDATLRTDQAPLEEAVERAWGSALTALHGPSLTLDGREHVIATHDAGLRWLRSAIAARDPALATDDRPGLPLSEALRRLMRADRWQLTVHVLEAGDEATALGLVSPGNRYLLGRMVDPSGAERDPTVRFARDQAVGLWTGRRTDYLGLRRPLPLPYGEASTPSSDPRMYARVIDIRIALSLALEELGLAPALHAPLLPLAMADVLASIRPDTQVAWEEMLAAISQRVTVDAVTRWIEDLAFAGTLQPADPGPADGDLVSRARGAAAARTARNPSRW